MLGWRQRRGGSPQEETFQINTESKKNKEKARLSESSKVLKRPAAALKKPAAAAAASGLSYPGTDKRPPLHYGNSVVYFSPNRFRVMVKKTDRVDKAFTYTSVEPREAWREVVKLLRESKPGVAA